MKYYDLKRTLALLSLDDQYTNIKEACHNIGANIDDISNIGIGLHDEIIISFKPRLPEYLKINKQ